MRAGIIAAGHGQRLSASHPGTIKPLVPVAGQPLVHWVVDSLLRAGAREITVVHNSGGRAVRESLTGSFPKAVWSFLERDTASSWETFRILSAALAGADSPFLISTVDAIAAPSEVARFAREAAQAPAALALTDFIDDEKPLWADVDGSGRITALGEDARQRKLATSGLYWLTPALASRMPDAAAYSSLRGYLGSLVRGGTAVSGIKISKTLDVDRPEDVRAAEGFLKEVAGSW
jgi:NDP-sugar pyrophosphorylase family protein